jgi:2-polyprenyl-3-methyl-5-hydroxy-6-metoxy-1,4-benzoquinol methylase
MLGHEQIYNPSYSILEKLYIAALGMPIVGLRIRARNVLSLIPKGRKYNRILDAGSGSGVFSFELARRFAKAKVLGVDLLQEAVEACRHIEHSTRASNVSFRQGSVEDLPEEGLFDLILCVDLLEHIQGDMAALKGLFRSAAPGAVLVLHVPALYRRYPVWKKTLNFDVETHARTGYEPHEIRDKVLRSGFLIRKTGFTYGFWETLANNISYMITRAKMENRKLYALAFPFLYSISLLGFRARPKKMGAGIFIVAEKRS